MNFKFSPEFLRSTPMKLFDLNLPRETAFDIVSHLGELSLLHFIDSCHDVALFSRKYANSIKRCEINLLKIDELNEIMKKFHKDLTKSKDIKSFLSEFRFFLKGRKITETSYFEEKENSFQIKIHYLIGIILKEDLIRFKRILFRTSKGNAVVFSEDLPMEENPIDWNTVKIQCFIK